LGSYLNTELYGLQISLKATHPGEREDPDTQRTPGPVTEPTCLGRKHWPGLSLAHLLPSLRWAHCSYAAVMQLRAR
jgi:hypothetical protein